MSTPVHVLHVDDEPSFGELVADFLERKDAQINVTTESSAADGIERLTAGDDAFDCIVSDYDMPGKTGLEFLDEVRNRYPDLPFILFTGKGSEEVASEAISAGATDYLQKRGGTEQYDLLANRVRNAVEQYRSTQERDRVYQALETATQGIGLLNDDGEYIYLNEAYTDLYGYDTDDLIGEHWSRLYPNEEETRFEEEILPTLEEEGSWNGRSQGLCHDGSIIPEQVSLTQLDSGGHVCVVQDISDQVEREQELELRNRAIDEAPVGVTMTDPSQEDNPIIYANDEFITVSGYSREELIGENHRILQGPETRDAPVTKMREAIEAQEPVTVELRNYRKNGEMFWNRVSIAPVYDSDGAVVNYIGFQEEITDRKAREQKLERSERQFEAMFNDPNILVGLIDLDGTVLDINETAISYTDATRADVVDNPFWETPWFSGDPALEEQIKQLIDRAASGEYAEFELDLSTAMETPLVVTGVIRPVTNADGEVVSLLISDRDITERKERERRFDALLNDPNILVGLLKTDGTVVDTNETSLEYVAADRAAAVGDPIWEGPWWSEETKAMIQSKVEQAAQGEYVGYEAELTKPDGEPYSVRGVIRPVTDANGRVTSLFISARDVTERLEREKLLEAILENTTSLIFMKDRSGEYLLANRSFREVFDLEESSIRGQTDADLFADEVATELRKNDTVALEGGEPVETEEQVMTADGERIYFSSKVPVYDIGVESDPDEPVAVIGVANDITEQKRRETELTQVRDRMQFALEQTDVVIWERDIASDEITTYPDPCPIVEDSVATADEFCQLVHPDERSTVEEAMQTVIESAEPQTLEYRTSDNVEAEWIEAQVEPVVNEEGSVSKLIGVAKDITDRKRREQTLKRQNERFEELANSVSHDLETPISTARGRAELAIETGDTDQMKKALKALERADQLRENLVKVLRTGDLVGETEPVDIGTVAKDVWQSVTASDEASLRVDSSLTVEGDSDAIRRLLENLFSNAIEHGGTAVTVTLGQIDGGFYVEDDGPGIPAENRDDIFTPGYSTKESGTGVGMVSVREIVLAHEWSISVTESDRGGARFEIQTNVTND